VTSRASVAPIVRALLDGLIDYAGLFPPASLGMAHAVANYAAYRRGPCAWMLGRFIVPTARLDEFEAAAAGRLDEGLGAIPWRLSVLAGPDVASDFAAIATFNLRHALPSPQPSARQRGEGVRSRIAPDNGGTVRIEAIELKLDAAADIASIAARTPSGVALWFEVTPGPSLGADLARVAEAGHGAKIRTGGVSPDLIPSTKTVADFLLGFARAGMRFKATAGLHHPIRAPHRLTYADDSPTAMMHGFLNVFLAAAVARELVLHSYPDPEAHTTVASLVEETDPHAFVWHDDGVRWRRHRVNVAGAIEARTSACSFGSCSFEEPVEDLRQLGLV
jgi:hypothetical protein